MNRPGVAARLLRGVKLATSHPRQFAVRALGRICPALLFARYVSLAKKQGLKRPYFILTFDCDTDLDIAVVESVHSKLMGMGIMPIYAVPGKMLEKGRETYLRIANTGADFISHGYFEHCRFNPVTRTYESDYFYDQMTPEMIREDIQKGRQVFIDIFKKEPKGFRVPHFGTFQQDEHLDLLHSCLKDLGYLYSSSTTPQYGFLQGPIFRSRHGVYEIPVSGCYDQPLNILDSWGFRYDEHRQVNEDDFARQFGRMLSFVTKHNAPGLLNFYADPSQVHDWPAFFQCMETAAKFSVPSFEFVIKESLGAENSSRGSRGDS